MSPGWFVDRRYCEPPSLTSERRTRPLPSASMCSSERSRASIRTREARSTSSSAASSSTLTHRPPDRCRTTRLRSCRGSTAGARAGAFGGTLPTLRAAASDQGLFRSPALGEREERMSIPDERLDEGNSGVVSSRGRSRRRALRTPRSKPAPSRSSHRCTCARDACAGLPSAVLWAAPGPASGALAQDRPRCLGGTSPCRSTESPTSFPSSDSSMTRSSSP